MKIHRETLTNMVAVGVCLLMCALVGIAMLIGCDSNRNEPEPKHGVVVPGGTVEEQKPATYDWSKVITVGDASYIPLDVYAKPKDRAREILTVLNAFKKSHPELVVKDWDIEKTHEGHFNDYIDGLWVDHEPGETAEKK